MKIIAKFPVQLNDHIYYKGESCDYKGPITERIADNFTDADGNSLSPVEGAEEPVIARDDGKDKIRKTVDVMGREGIKRSLDAMNITYSPNAGTEYLAKLLLAAKGEISE